MSSTNTTINTGLVHLKINFMLNAKYKSDQQSGDSSFQNALNPNSNKFLSFGQSESIQPKIVQMKN